MSKRKTNQNRGGRETAAKSDKGTKGLVIVVFVLIVAIVYAITSLSLGYVRKTGAPVWNPLKWGKSGTADNGETINPVIAVSSDGEAIRTGSVYSMRRSADNGITYLTETQGKTTYIPDGEIIVTAELSNEFINGAFEWTAEFADPAAEWAVGKVAGYYVSVTPIAGDSSRATLRYLEPFGEQIILTATLRGTESSDSCTIDCVKAATLSDYRFPSNTDDQMTVDAKLSFSVGTVVGDFSFFGGLVEFTDEFIRDFQDYLKFDVSVHSIGLNSVDNVTVSNSEIIANLDKTLRYADFISNFANYDTAHKEAIYYAWFNSAKASKWAPNCYLTASFSYNYSGVTVATINCEELLCSYCITGEITDDGDAWASELAPNVTLNKNYVF